MALKKGDILQLDIIDSGIEGEGIAKHEGMAVFVPFVLIGETVKVQITFVKKSFARAKVIKLLKGSPFRCQPPCPLFRKCGGCDYQHISYDAQLEIKRNEVATSLKKYARLDVEVDETISSPKTFRYRNKVQLPISAINGKIKVGFFKKNSHDFIAVDDCLLQGDWAKEIILAFEDFASSSMLDAYDEQSAKGLLRHLVLRKLGDTVSIIVCINGKSLPHKEKLIALLRSKGISFNLFYSVNTKPTNVILGEPPALLYGSESVQCDIFGVKALVSAASFMQINDDVRDMLYAFVADIISRRGSLIVFDVFSGVGILSNIITKSAQKVFGIEIVSEAVKNADDIAKLNGNSDKITNVCGDAAVILPKLASEVLMAQPQQPSEINSTEPISEVFNDGANKPLPPSAVILDPPRKGCDEAVLNAILETKPDTVIYISCNPATLARDLKILTDSYKVISVTPFDMFPQCSHIETLVCMTRK